MWVEDWAARAACKGETPDALFVRGAEQNKAKQVCAGCPVRTECLAEALDNQIEWGVWGGMTERERRALLRQARPDRAQALEVVHVRGHRRRDGRRHLRVRGGEALAQVLLALDDVDPVGVEPEQAGGQ